MPEAPEPSVAVRRMSPYNPPLEGRSEKLRLDFNENVSGCSPRVLETVRQAASRGFLATYPEYAEMLRRLGAHFGVDSDQVTIGAGTDEVINGILHAFVNPGDEVIMPKPSFAMFRFYTQLVSGVPVQVPYKGSELAFPAEEIAAAIGPNTKAVCIATPNNPSGGVASRDEVLHILAAADRRVVLVDEAYFDFHGETMLDLVKDWPNLFVTRTFSKAYGMAGMRVGMAVSQSGNIAIVRKGQSPYGVNSLAVRCALAAMEDTDYVRQYVRQVLEAREVLCDTLERLGIRYWPSRANFVLFELGEGCSRACERLSAMGILIRDQSAYLPGTARVTVGPLGETAQFVAAFREVLAK